MKRRRALWITMALGLAVLTRNYTCTCFLDQSIAPDDAFVVLIDAAPGSLDPRFALSDYGAKISRLIFSSLVTVDTATGAPELDLAIEVRNPSATVYEVEIRRDAVFHDGHPLTAEDIVYTFRSLEEVESPLSGQFRDTLIEATGDYSVRFELPEPYAPFMSRLGMGIVPAHLLRESGTFGENPLIGSGPFRFEGQRLDHEIVISANPAYYGDVPNLEFITFRLVRDNNSRLLAILSGSSDLVQNAVPPLMLPVLESYDNLSIESSPSFKYTYIVFNTRHEILNDMRVRQAIALGIDREEIIERKFLGMARLSTGMLPPDHWAYEANVTNYRYDPERAAALLDEAGYPMGSDGEPRFRLVFKVSADKFRRSIATLIAHQLGAIGIEVEVQSYEWGTFFFDVRSGNFEMATLQWVDTSEPDLYHYIFHSDSIPASEPPFSGGNRGAYSNPEVDALIEDGRRTLDVEARSEIYRHIQRILAEEVPYVSLWHEDNFVITNRGVVGYEMTPNARFRYLARTRLVD